MIDHINRTRECHVVTIEDPIEVLHRDDVAAISQREVGFDTKSFLVALRAALREDPDVILVGEMRDPETVATALSAAETGHLVFSTLHTVDAVETINRVVDFFPANQQRQARLSLAGALKGTICQRLVPTTDGAGRVPALEIMIVNGRIQQTIVDPTRGTDINEVIREGQYYGMQSFDQALVNLIEAGIIDLRAAAQASSNPHDLRVALQQRGLMPASAAH
ncbi:MAG: ATPase, T2SS/T4P/T4SS family, partial [Actinomycetota bacterium]|nr:ATPase, T2SS/T4P/T4SS family [Actinomycetota bacterium]